MGNRIWIELDKPADAAHAHLQCKLANNMLKRLNVNAKFWYSEREHTYCFGGDNGYKTLPDNGEWLNLDHLGRE